MMGQQVKRVFAQYAGAFAACALLAACGKVAESPYVESVEQLPSGFFRVFADIRVRETGEIVKLDYVAACGGTVTNWTYTTPSVSFGMAPHIMLVPTASGELIGARTPEVCDGSMWGPERIRVKDKPDIVRELVPDDFLPLLMWYPNADDIGFAIGYLSDKAYESPYAKMEVLSSGIAKSSLEEWQTWRASAEANYKQVGALPGPWGHQIPGRIGSTLEGSEQLRQINRGQEPDVSRCSAVDLLRMPEEGRGEVLALLPETNTLWVPNLAMDEEVRKKVFEALSRLSYNGGHILNFGQTVHETGVRKSTGGGAFRLRELYGNNNFYRDYYPVIPYQPAATNPETGEVTLWQHEALFDDAWNGFGICGYTSPPKAELEAYMSGESETLQPDYSGRPVNGPARPKEGKPEELVSDGVVIIPPWKDSGGPWFYGSGGGGFVISRDGRLITYCCTR